MADESTGDETSAKADHEPPAGAETTRDLDGRRHERSTTRRARTGSCCARRRSPRPRSSPSRTSPQGGDADRPVTFVFNGGPGASSAYLHMGAVGPQRVAFPADGTLPHDAATARPERRVVARVHRPRLRRPGRHGLQPRDRGRREDERGRDGQEGRRARTTSRPEGVLRLQARPRVALRVHGPLAVGATDAGARRSSSPARATAATASAASCGMLQETPGSGSTARS